MKRTISALATAGIIIGACAGLSGCVARTHASVGVGVEAGPPEPVEVYYDERPGYTWIEGRWVWGAYGWQWYPGYWVAARPGYMYVSGYWDYYGGRYYYRPGTWSRYRNGHVYVGGRWTPYQRNAHYDYRSRRWVPRGGGDRHPGRWSSGSDRRGHGSSGGYHAPRGRS